MRQLLLPFANQKNYDGIPSYHTYRNGAATIWYKGLERTERTVSAKAVPDRTGRSSLTLPDRVYQKWVKGLSGKVI